MRISDWSSDVCSSDLIYGVLGPNGAGKKTTLRMLLGIIEPDDGEREMLGCRRPRQASDRVGYLPEESGLYPEMKAAEAIDIMGALRGLGWSNGRKRARQMIPESRLAEPADQNIRQHPQ